MPERDFGYPDPSDTNFLRLIVGFLREIYEHGVLLSGIIYFHSMNDRRLEGVSLRSFKIFQRLCGDIALKNIVLTTSEWNWIIREEEDVDFAEQEQELISNVWSRMITGGSRVRRYWCDRNTAEQILREVVQHTPVALGIQHELVDEHKRLVDTVAGSYVHENLKQLQQGYQEALNECFEKSQTSKTTTRSLWAFHLLTLNRCRRCEAGRSAKVRKDTEGAECQQGRDQIASRTMTEQVLRDRNTNRSTLNH
jgi:hypothetical protein